MCVCAYVSVAFGSKGVGVHHDGRAVLLCSLAEPLCPLESGRLLPGQEIGLPLETLAPGGAPVPAGTDGRCSGVVRSGPLCPLESGRLLPGQEMQRAADAFKAGCNRTLNFWHRFIKEA